MRQKVRFNIVQLKVCGVQGLVAGLAEPQEAVRESLASALALDDQADAARFAHGGVRRFGGAYKHVAGLEHMIHMLSVGMGSHRDSTL